jgi:dipeptidyl aminopeptidase/acylaminoacyl peptidase
MSRLPTALAFSFILFNASQFLAAHAEPMRVKDLLAVKWISQVTVSPDDKHVAFVISEADYENNQRQGTIYLAATQGPPSAMRQLTSSSGSNTSPALSPSGKRLAFVSTRGGTPQIWLLPLDRGEAVQLTQLSAGAWGPIWSPDGKLIAFTSSVYPDCKDERCNARRIEAQKKSKVTARIFDGLLIRHWNEWRDERRSHVFVIPVPRATGADAQRRVEPRDLTPGPADAPPLALGSSRDYVFSRDGRHLAYVSNTDRLVATSTNNDVFEVPVSGGKAVRISFGQGNDYSPRYSPDGKFLAYLSMARPGYESDRPRILVRERKGGKIVEWSRGYSGSPQSLVWAPDSKRLYFTAPHQGQMEIFAARAEGVKQLSRGLFAKELNVSRDGRALYFTDEAADRPPELFSLNPAGEIKRALTDLNAWLPRKALFQRAEHVWFKSEGGIKIHAILLKPPGFKPGQKYPAVLVLHGGPQQMSSDDFHPRWNLQMFAAEGYVVFGINFRGSIGFGQPFMDSIRGEYGGKPYRDVMKGMDYLTSLPFVQAKSVCAAGASYGGYLTNWIAAQTKRFSCLITHAGIYNLESKYGATEELWFPEWEMRGTPWSNRELYRQWSPHARAENIRTPTLVIHGQKDFRVPVEEGLQMYTALQRQGVASRLLYFPDEDHFVQKPQNVELWWKTVHDWLARYLRAKR